MSKKGRKEPRWILFNVARSAIGCNDMIRELYNSYVEKGKSKMSALGIIMHKILRIIYGMLKNNTKYDPQIDMANRTRKNSSTPVCGPGPATPTTSVRSCSGSAWPSSPCPPCEAGSGSR